MVRYASIASRVRWKIGLFRHAERLLDVPEVVILADHLAGFHQGGGDVGDIAFQPDQRPGPLDRCGVEAASLAPEPSSTRAAWSRSARTCHWICSPRSGAESRPGLARSSTSSPPTGKHLGRLRCRRCRSGIDHGGEFASALAGHCHRSGFLSPRAGHRTQCHTHHQRR